MRPIFLLFFLINWPVMAQAIHGDVIGSTSPMLTGSGRETASPMTLYVSPTGSDSNDCLSAVTPCTLPGVVQNLQGLRIKHPVNIYAAAGNYSSGGVIDGLIFGRAADPAVGAYVRIRGTYGPATLTTGVTSGTVASLYAGSGRLYGTLTVTDAGWTVDDLRGELLRVTDGTSTWMYSVVSNTTDTVTVAGLLRDDNTFNNPTIGTTLEVLTPTSIITGTTTRQATMFGNGYAPSQSSVGASWIVTGPTQQSDTTTGNIFIEGFHYTASRAFYVMADVGLSVRYSTFDQTVSNGSVLIALDRQGSLDAYVMYVKLKSSGVFINQFNSSTSTTRRLSIGNHVVDGVSSGTVVALSSAQTFISQNSHVKSVQRVYRLGNIESVFLRAEQWDGCTENCFYGNGSTAGASGGQWSLNDLDVKNYVTTAVNTGKGPVYVRMDDAAIQGSISSSATGCAFRLTRGATVSVKTGKTAMVGSGGCDFEVDDAAFYTFIYMRTLTPVRISTADGTTMREES